MNKIKHKNNNNGAAKNRYSRYVCKCVCAYVRLKCMNVCQKRLSLCFEGLLFGMLYHIMQIILFFLNKTFYEKNEVPTQRTLNSIRHTDSALLIIGPYLHSVLTM